MKGKSGVCLLGLACALASGAAQAQARGAESAGAETLFQQGVALMNENHFEQACSKFEGSSSLDPALGTLLRLGDCYDRMGKTASAWTAFQDALSLARNRKEAERQQMASERVADLERRLSWLHLSVAAGEPTRDLSLRVDGASVSLALLQSPIPFDPGMHRIELSAPGRRAWSGSLEVASGPSRQTHQLPRLEPEPAPPAAPAPSAAAPPPAQQAPGASHAWSIALGVAGLVGLATGGVLSYQALRVNRDARSECDAHNLCSAAGVERRDSAIAYANGATIAMVSGAALLTGGVGIWLWSPGPARPAADQAFAPRLQLSTALSMRGAQLDWGGSF